MTLVDPVAFDIDEPVLPVRAPPKELHLGGDSADPVAPEAWLARIADEATGLLGALGEQRWSDPMRARGETERRIAAVRAALATCGVAAPLAAAENARRGRQDGRPWAFWPAGLADDGDVAAWLQRAEAALGQTATHAEVEVLVDAAMADGRGGEKHALADALASAESPPLRALLIALLTRVEALGASMLEHEASSASAPVCVAAALRGLSRKDGSARALRIARAHLDHTDADVRWEAARDLALWGAPDVVDLLRGPALCERLGTRGAQLVVMCGEAEDLASLERVAHATGLTPAILGAVARFGHPQAWSLLLHALVEPELASDALDALRTLFGPLVPDADAHLPAAWREAIAALDLDDDARILRGRPWTLEAAAAELGRHDVPVRTLAARLDELRARTGQPLPAELSPRLPAPIEALAAAQEQARRTPWRQPAGTWGAARR